MTSSRRPILEPGESVNFVQSGVGLYSGKYKASEYSSGVLYLTGTRICYVDSDKPSLRSIALALEKIDKIEHFVRHPKTVACHFTNDTQAGFLKSSPKVRIRYKSDSSFSTDGSGTSSPLPAAMIPAKQKSLGDWICPICTFTNAVQLGHFDGAPMPPCINCGMKPPKNLNISISASSTPVISRPASTAPLSYNTTTHSGGVRSSRAMTFPCPRCTFGNHPAITACELCGAPLLSNNLPPMLNSNAANDERQLPQTTVNRYNSTDEMTCKLSFRSTGDKVFLERLKHAVAEQAWIKNPPAIEYLALEESSRPRHRGAGIGALQSREEVVRSQDASTMSGAFEDLEGLMSRAKEMIALAESFAQRIAAAPASIGILEAKSLIFESNAALGLSSPIVTKDLMGKSGVFHEELARQITDFLEDGRLRREGGAITLVDLYALYNRARKGDLISPEDLYIACQQFDVLKLPIRLRKFRSGILVVQDRSRSDASTRRAVLTWLQARTLGASALDAADRFGWSIGVAKEELEMVEEHGDIARDVGVQGLRFYENEINKWDWKAWGDITV